MAAVQDTSISSNGNNEDSLTQLQQKIVRQLEYYFGDKNYPKDKFLRQKADEDDGWVTFECLLTFSRLKALTTSEEVLVESIKKSKSKLLEISEDGKKLRRLKSIPLPENTMEARQASKAKTVYCKGFPKETTLDELEEFFGTYGKIVHIMMRRLIQTKEFKGSVFVEFTNLDDAKKLVAEEKLQFKDEELIKMSKEEYYKMKDKERAQEKEDNKKKAAEKEMEKEKSKTPTEDNKEETQEEDSFPTGSVLFFKGVGEQTSREDLKELFGDHEEINWVDFARGDTEGYIRFSNEGAAQRAIDAVKAANDGKICIRNVESEVHVLVDEEELKYFEKVKEGKAQVRQKKADKRGSAKRGRSGWGARGRGRGRGGKRTHGDAKVKSEEKGNVHIHFDNDEPASKQAKVQE